MYNNQVISITGEVREAFERALWFFLPSARPEVVGYATQPLGDPQCRRVILFWSEHSSFEGYTPLFYPMGRAAITDFLWHWLQTAPYTQKPDIDGDCIRGWRVYNEAWTHVAGQWQALFAVDPFWLMAGK